MAIITVSHDAFGAGHAVAADTHAIPVADDEGGPLGAILLLHDASSETSLEERCQNLHEKATRDPMTQVANRAEFDRVHAMFVAAHQQQQIRVQLSNILQAIVSQRLLPAIGGGRLAVAEVMVANPAVRNIIREGKTHQLDAVIQTGAEEGMQTMDRALAAQIKAGHISYDEAKGYAIDEKELERLVHG